jgi:protein-tyrosine-phosphatase
MERMQRILFVDPDHGARSQMAEALLRRAAAGRYEIGSAGTEPTGSLDGVEAILHEVGVDRFVPTRRAIVSALDPPPDLLVTVCEEGCGSCPYVPGSRRVARWPQPDPDRVSSGERLGVLRQIRDDLEAHVARLVEERQL